MFIKKYLLKEVKKKDNTIILKVISTNSLILEFLIQRLKFDIGLDRVHPDYTNKINDTRILKNKNYNKFLFA